MTIELNGRKYSEAFLKRCNCKVCGDKGIDLDMWFFHVRFSKEVEELRKRYPEYEGLRSGSASIFLCYGCAVEMLREFPEVVEKLEKVIQI